MNTRNLLYSSVALGMAAMTQQATAEKIPARPNILFIFSDDHCHEEINALGNKEIITPNMDKLVQNGTTFTNTFNSGAWSMGVCLASRTMIFSGVQVWDAAKLNLKEHEKQGRFWPQLMQKAGYETYFAGKWHVGKNDMGLCQRLFVNTKNIRKNMPNQTKSGYNRPKSEDDKSWLPWDKSKGGHWKGGKHWSEVLADDGISFLDQTKDSDKPFCMTLCFSAPHDPRQAPKEYVDMYPLDKISLPKSYLDDYPYREKIGLKKLRDENLAPHPRSEHAVKTHIQEYYAITTHMDTQIGRILEHLKATGQDKNTIVVYSSDHGLAVGKHGLMGKQNMYDHSLRPPFIVSGPGIAKDKKIDSMIYLQDIFPTALELAGTEVPSYLKFSSVLPLLKGDKSAERKAVYAAWMDVQRAVRTDKYKLIFYPKAKKWRLFDIQKDKDEVNDLIDNPEFASVVTEMKNTMKQQMKENNDPMLSKKLF